MNRDATRIVVCDEQVTGRRVAGDVDGTRPKTSRRAMNVQRARRGNLERGDAMVVAARSDTGAGVTGATVTPRDVKEGTGCRGPCFLHEAWHHQRRLPRQCGSVDVSAEGDELFADAGVDRHLARGRGPIGALIRGRDD